MNMIKDKVETKIIKNKNKIQEKIIKITNTLVDIVKITMGPEGKNVMINSNDGDKTLIIWDGIKVAKSIQLKDPIEWSILRTIRQAIIKTNEEAGDGTTVTSILTQAFLNASLWVIRSSQNYISTYKLIQRLELLLKWSLDILRSKTWMVKDDKSIYNVAWISSNSEQFGWLILDAIQKIGISGMISIDNSNTHNTYLEVQEGFKINNGFISKEFTNDRQKEECILKKPYVVLYNLTSTNLTIWHLAIVIEAALKENVPLLIITNDLPESCLSNLVFNKRLTLKNVHLCVVKMDGFGEEKNNKFNDLSTLINGTIIDDNNIKDIKDLNLFSWIDTAFIHKNSTFIIPTEEQKNNKNINILKNDLDKKCNQIDRYSFVEREWYKKWLSNVSKGLAIIKLGAQTDIEYTDKKERLIDALNSTKMALNKGIVVGGGLIYIHIKYELLKQYNQEDTLKDAFFDQNLHLKQPYANDYIFQTALNIFLNAFDAPIRQILVNADLNAPIIVQEIKKKIIDDQNFYAGYDVEGWKFVNMQDVGIFDTSQVIESALKNSLSVVKQLILTEGSVIRHDRDKNSNLNPYV